MEKFVNVVVEKRMIFLIVFAVLFVASFAGWYFVKINYDFISYLPKDSTIIKSLNVMGREFNARGAVSILVTNMESEDRIPIMEELSKVDGVANVAVSHYSEERKAGLVSIFLINNDYNTKSEDCVKEIERRLKNLLKGEHEYYRSGSAATAIASRHSVEVESRKSLGIALIFVIAVLIITTKSFIEPVCLLIVIGAAIIINYGTNIIMVEISFVSNSISAVLLVALSMDYSIVLVSRFREERDKIGDEIQAMKIALKGAIITIISSGCTVMAGLLSLVTMKNNIGLDLGLVLTKGVLISLIAVIFLMPAILLLFHNLIKKTEHRSFLPNMKKVGTFAKITRFAFPIAFVCIAISAIIFQEFKLVYEFNPVMETDKVRESQRKTAEIFDEQNQMVIIVPLSIPVEKQIDISTHIRELKTKKEGNPIVNFNVTYMALGILDLKLGTLLDKFKLKFFLRLEENETDWVMSRTKSRSQIEGTAYIFEIIKTFNETDIKEYFTKEKPDVMKTMNLLIQVEDFASFFFNSKNYTRMIYNIKSKIETKESLDCIRDIKDYLNEVIGESNYNIISQTDNCIETKRIFKTDKILVDAISAIAVLIIVMIATRSIAMPVILVLLIEGSIFINLSFQALGGNHLYFIVYLLGVAIQMGSTIDYGILVSDRYAECRKSLGKFDAITSAIQKSFPTVISSGSILTLVAFTLAVFCKVNLVSSIGTVVCVGTLTATLTMLFMLPQFLILCDFIIEKTTYKANFVKADTEKKEDDDDTFKDESFIANETEKPLFKNDESVEQENTNTDNKDIEQENTNTENKDIEQENTNTENKDNESKDKAAVSPNEEGKENDKADS